MGREAETIEDEGVADDEVVETNVPTDVDGEADVEQLIFIEGIEAYLNSLHYTLWADWDVSIPDRRRKAAEWFMAQMDDLEKFLLAHPELGIHV